MAGWDKTIGFKRLALAHVNDSKTELGSRVDRHEHIGKGEIGMSGFEALASHPVFGKLDWILETETEGRSKDVNILKKLKTQNPKLK